METEGCVFAETVMFLAEHITDIQTARQLAGEATMRLPENADFPATVSKALDILEARKAA
jgi:hypothetical protein